MLGGVQLYKEPFLLPTESLTVGLGDTRKISVSNGLDERTEGQGVFVSGARGGHSSAAQGLEGHVLDPDPLRNVPLRPTTTLRGFGWQEAATSFRGPFEKLGRPAVDTQCCRFLGKHRHHPSEIPHL